MSIIFIYLTIIFIASCDSSLKYNDFIAKKNVDEIGFQMDRKECLKEGDLLANKSEGSKRAGEILLDTKYYKISCMKRKGWSLKNK